MDGSARQDCQWFYRRMPISGSWICSCSATPWARLEDSRITSTTILLGDHVWCTTESRNEIIRTRSLSHCQESEFATPLLTWSSPEHGLLASRLGFCIPAWPYRNDLEDHYSRDLRIWQTRVDRVVCRDRRKYKDDCSWSLSLSGLQDYLDKPFAPQDSVAGTK